MSVAIARSLRTPYLELCSDARQWRSKFAQEWRDKIHHFDVGSIWVGSVVRHRWAGRNARLRDAGWWEAINHYLVMADCERVGRDASSTAAILDSQSVKTMEAGGPRGYDAGKKVLDRKRQALVDTGGRGLTLQAQPASVQDRDGAGPVLRASRARGPFLERAFADAGYAGDRAAKASRVIVEIVRKPLGQTGIAVQPRRWAEAAKVPPAQAGGKLLEGVERFFARIDRNRRLAKDFEATVASAEAFLYAASAMILLRRLARC